MNNCDEAVRRLVRGRFETLDVLPAERPDTLVHYREALVFDCGYDADLLEARPPACSALVRPGFLFFSLHFFPSWSDRGISLHFNISSSLQD